MDVRRFHSRSAYLVPIDSATPGNRPGGAGTPRGRHREERPSMQARTLTAVLAAAVVLLLPAAANAAQTPEQILSALAANQTHSWVDDGIGYPAMLAKVKAGERLYVTCGN